jgi:DNA helicase-2/ATP-dependent DNA helicase PcrA
MTEVTPPSYPIIGEDEHPATSSLKIHGPPGSGKTTQLLLRLIVLLQAGYQLSDVTFVTYHKALASDILSRLAEYGFIDESDLEHPTTGKTRYFGTIHGISNRISRGAFSGLESAKSAERRDFMRTVYSRPYDAPATRSDIIPVGKLAFDCIEWLIKNRIPLSQATRAPQYVEYRSNWRGGPSLEEFRREWNEYKAENGLFDFTDQLELALERGRSPGTPVLIVDEAQDMYPLLFELVESWRENTEVVIIAGDPHQTVNGHEGASPEFFDSIDLPTVALPDSHRVPELHWQAARRLLNRHHQPPNLNVRKLPEATLEEVRSPEFGYRRGQWVAPTGKFSAPWLVKQYESEGDVLLTARTRLQCLGIAWSLMEAGVLFRSQNGLLGWNTAGVGEGRTRLFNALQKIRYRSIIESENGDVLPTKVDSPERRLTLDEARTLLRAVNPRVIIRQDISSRRTRETVWKRLEKHESDRISLRELAPFLKKEFWVRYTRGPGAVEWLHGFFEQPREQMALRKALMRTDKTIESLEDTPRLSTIHSAKGGQATTVVCYDGVPRRVRQKLHRPGAQGTEDLIWYVGLTRSLKNLVIVRGGFSWITPYLSSSLINRGERHE